MARLYRPYVPLSVRVHVAERQFDAATTFPYENGERNASVFRMFVDRESWKRSNSLRSQLDTFLGLLFGDVAHQLDHDPPLGARPRRRHGLGRKTYYTPDANDPDHLFYRPHGPEHAGSHLVKTNVRGDRGQHPDRVLIKKARRRERSHKGETRRKASGFPKRAFEVKHSAGLEPQIASGRFNDARARVYDRKTKRVPKAKHRWPKRPLGSRRKP